MGLFGSIGRARLPTTPGFGDGVQLGGGMQSPMPAKKPGFFGKGGAWRDVLGTFGDAFSEGEPIYTAQKMERSRLIQQAQQAEQARQQDRDEWEYRQRWERDNPKAPQRTEFERILDASGVDPETRQKLLRDYVNNRANPAMPVQGVDANGNPTITFVPRNGPQASGPPPAPVGRLKPYGGQSVAPAGTFRP